MMNRGRLMRPPYVDPQTQIIYDCDHSEYESWLTKQSMWLKDWRRRYFILKGSKLFFSKNEYQAPHGMIDLAQCTTVKSADWKSKKRHSFEISTPELTYLLYADTEGEKDDWIGRVGKAIVHCSRTYVGGVNGGGGGGVGESSSPTSAAGIALGGGAAGGMPGANMAYGQPSFEGQDYDDDDDIYTNDDPDNPYFND